MPPSRLLFARIHCPCCHTLGGKALAALGPARADLHQWAEPLGVALALGRSTLGTRSSAHLCAPSSPQLRTQCPSMVPCSAPTLDAFILSPSPDTHTAYNLTCKLQAAILPAEQVRAPPHPFRRLRASHGCLRARL